VDQVKDRGVPVGFGTGFDAGFNSVFCVPGGFPRIRRPGNRNRILPIFGIDPLYSSGHRGKGKGPSDFQANQAFQDRSFQRNTMIGTLSSALR
jgi:hypothetical protein